MVRNIQRGKGKQKVDFHVNSFSALVILKESSVVCLYDGPMLQHSLVFCLYESCYNCLVISPFNTVAGL